MCIYMYIYKGGAFSRVFLQEYEGFRMLGRLEAELVIKDRLSLGVRSATPEQSFCDLLFSQLTKPI